MTKSPRRARRRAYTLFLAASAAGAVWPVVGLAATDNYTGASGTNWATGTNWARGLPTTGTAASIVASTGNPFTVLFNDSTYTPPPHWLGSAGFHIQQHRRGTEHNSGDSLYAATEYVGLNEYATLNQSSGTNSVSGTSIWLYLGDNAGSNGTYMLSNTGVLNVAGMSVGYNGAGSFNQSAGTVSTTATGFITIGDQSSGVGTYSLSGGTLNANTSTWLSTEPALLFIVPARQPLPTSLAQGTSTANGIYSLSSTGLLNVSAAESIGEKGTGSFVQTGGTNTISGGGNLTLGGAATASGLYSLSGTGSLTVSGNEEVGNGGTGIFNQSGGTNTANNDLFVGYSMRRHILPQRRLVVVTRPVRRPRRHGNLQPVQRHKHGQQRSLCWLE